MLKTPLPTQPGLYLFIEKLPYDMPGVAIRPIELSAEDVARIRFEGLYSAITHILGPVDEPLIKTWTGALVT